MNPDIQHLIRLQQLDSEIESARRRIGEIPSVQDALATRLEQATSAVASARPAFVPRGAACLAEARRVAVSEGWAHQDSNLERAGYEPAALTVELWARYSLQSPVVSRQSPRSRPFVSLPTADCRLPTAD